MRVRDFEFLADLFTVSYGRDKDVVAALRAVFAVDDVDARGTADATEAHALKLARRSMPKRDRLTKYRHAQLLLPIVEEVARAHGLEKRDLTGANRHRVVANVRHEAMWLIRERTQASLPTIGMAMGGKDHTTVMSGIRRFESRMREDPALRARARAMVTGAPSAEIAGVA